MTDLALFDDIWLALPDTIDGDVPALSLSRDNLPAPPQSIHTDQLCLLKYVHFYNDFPVDAVSFEADKATFGKLGLLLLSAIFHRPQNRITIELTHPRSAINQLIIDPLWGYTQAMPGLHLSAAQLNYYPEPVSKHPWHWHCYNLQPSELPILYLTNQNEMLATAQDLESRNVAIGFGRLEGSCRFAELLLNCSRPSNNQLEFALEGEIGFRGVGPGSAEIIIWLPGSIGNLDYPPQFSA